MIVQVNPVCFIVKDNLTRYTVIPLLRASCSRQSIIAMLLYRKRGLPKSERHKAIRYRPMKIRQGNGASVVV